MDTTHEVRDLQMLVEGYRSMALTFEKALDEANWRLKMAHEDSIRQDKKIKELHAVIALLRPALRDEVRPVTVQYNRGIILGG